MKSVLLLVAAIVVAGPVLAEDAAPSAPESAPTAQGNTETSDLDKVVCKRQPPPLGSRLGGRQVCLTERAWRQQMKESRDFLKNQQDKAAGSGRPGG